jgi:hypothetical protein
MREDLIYFSDRRFMHLGWGYVSSTHVHCAPVLSVTFERDFWVQGRPGSPGLVRRGVVIPRARNTAPTTAASAAWRSISNPTVRSGPPYASRSIATAVCAGTASSRSTTTNRSISSS